MEDDEDLYQSDAPNNDEYEPRQVPQAPSIDGSYLDDLMDQELGIDNAVAVQRSPVTNNKRGHDLDEPYLSDVKRQKLESAPSSSLTSSTGCKIINCSPAILQHVFSYLNVPDLYSCLEVNKLFYTCLRASVDDFPPMAGALQPRDGNGIWLDALHLNAPGLPDPLEDASAKRMLDLLVGDHCESCQITIKPVISDDFLWNSGLWNSGPGNNGLRIIWPWQVRLCGQCFEKLTAKDVELLVTEDKFLLRGLPFVFRTSENHYVPHSLLQSRNAGIPPSIQLFKVFFRPAISKLRDDYIVAQQSSPQDAELWLKESLIVAKRTLDDSARWASWEAAIPPDQTLAQTVRQLIEPSHSITQHSTVQLVDPVRASMPPPISLPRLSISQAPTHQQPAFLNNPMVSAHAITPYSHVTTPYPFFGNPAHPQYYPPNLRSPLAPVNHLREAVSIPTFYPNNPYDKYNDMVNEEIVGVSSAISSEYEGNKDKSDSEIRAILAERKTDIETRCCDDINPALYPNVLQHMAAYKAAIVIARPLSDMDWQSLKPRLMDQRLEAEQFERDRLDKLKPGDYVNMITNRVIRRPGGGRLRAAGNDVQMDKSQKSIRNKLSAIAQEVIEDRWAGAQSLLQADCANFAADVLTNTVERFRAESSESILLESMKHVFDTRVKPITESMVRDLFKCAECEDTAKSYSFDGMMQHSGAKHDSDLSMGNVIVAWHAAVWPIDPPFMAHPSMSRKVPPNYVKVRETARYRSEEREPIVINTSVPSFMASLRQQPSSTVTVLEPAYPALEMLDTQQTSLPETKEMNINTLEGTTRHTSDNPFLKEFYAPPQTAGVEPREEIGKATKEIYERTAGISDLPDSVRLTTIIQHVARRYVNRFEKQLTIDVFMESLSTRNEMKAIRKWSGLRCKICVALAFSAGNQCTMEQTALSDKNYALFPLLNHFKKTHLNTTEHASLIDWTVDSIELPDASTLQSIQYMSGMTEEKLMLIAAALPIGVFSTEYPHTQPTTVHALTQPMQSNIQPKGGLHAETRDVNPEIYGISKSLMGSLQNEVDDTDMSMPEAGEDEYDPRRPIMSDNSPKPTRRRHSDGHHGASHGRKEVKRSKPSKLSRASRHNEFFDYTTQNIPEVIRTPYDPNLEDEATVQSNVAVDIYQDDDIPSPVLQRNAPTHLSTLLQTAPTHMSTSIQTAPTHTSTSVQTAPKSAVGPNPSTRTASPPRYFDQYGNPVQLELIQTAQGYPQMQAMQHPSLYPLHHTAPHRHDLTTDMSRSIPNYVQTPTVMTHTPPPGHPPPPYAMHQSLQHTHPMSATSPWAPIMTNPYLAPQSAVLPPSSYHRHDAYFQAAGQLQQSTKSRSNGRNKRRGKSDQQIPSSAGDYEGYVWESD